MIEPQQIDLEEAIAAHSAFGTAQRFPVICADPPWSFKSWSDKNQIKATSRHYRLMTLEDIAALPVADLAADDAVLLLWVTNPMLPQGLEILKAWGFTYKTVAFTWAKTTTRSDVSWCPKYHLGLGYWTRANTEICLLGTRGKPKRVSKGVRQLIVEPRREHSRKPEGFYTGVERLVGGPYIELFSRTQRQGWSTWGFEDGKFGTANNGLLV